MREDPTMPIYDIGHMTGQPIGGKTRVGWAAPRRRYKADGQEESMPNPNMSVTRGDSIGFDADPFERLAQMRKQRRRGIVEGASFTQGRA